MVSRLKGWAVGAGALKDDEARQTSALDSEDATAAREGGIPGDVEVPTSKAVGSSSPPAIAVIVLWMVVRVFALQHHGTNFTT